jgi:hypothetical protein
MDVGRVKEGRIRCLMHLHGERYKFYIEIKEGKNFRDHSKNSKEGTKQAK